MHLMTVLITMIFSVVSYWLSNFRPGGTAFFTWVLWLYLDLVAAESLVVLVSSIIPIFVAALAIIAFTNGLWMAVGGFLVSTTVLNVFWKYVFHYIDYQAYVFQGMMFNEFQSRVYDCGASCQCMYQSALSDKCQIAGTAVLEAYGYFENNQGKNVGIMIAIIVAMRLFAWGFFMIRKS